MKRLLAGGLCASLLSACTETRTSDAADAFRYWAFKPAPKAVRVHRGQYWQSAHFTREYVVYLDLTAPSEWSQEYLRQNQLLPVTEAATRMLPADAPRWFSPDSSFNAYCRADIDGIYYLQPRTGRLLIYEQQF